MDLLSRWFANVRARVLNERYHRFLIRNAERMFAYFCWRCISVKNVIAAEMKKFKALIAQASERGNSRNRIPASSPERIPLTRSSVFPTRRYNTENRPLCCARSRKSSHSHWGFVWSFGPSSFFVVCQYELYTKVVLDGSLCR